MEKPIVTYADFDKLDLRVGTVLEVREVDGSEKLDELSEVLQSRRSCGAAGFSSC